MRLASMIPGVLALFGALCVPSGLHAESMTGPVVGVVDGDTLALLIDRTTVRVRIADIDAPERAQAFSSKSRDSLSMICRNGVATVTVVARDRYGRVVGHVMCSGVDAGEHQVSEGLAWTYPKYAPRDSQLYAMERSARESRSGLWSERSPIPPWEWRAKRRNESEQLGTDASQSVSGIVFKSDRRCSNVEGMAGADGTCIPWPDLVRDLTEPPGGELTPDQGCGVRGGPGYRRADGKCAGWRDW